MYITLVHTASNKFLAFPTTNEFNQLSNTNKVVLEELLRLRSGVKESIQACLSIDVEANLTDIGRLYQKTI